MIIKMVITMTMTFEWLAMSMMMIVKMVMTMILMMIEVLFINIKSRALLDVMVSFEMYQRVDILFNAYNGG